MGLGKRAKGYSSLSVPLPSAFKSPAVVGRFDYTDNPLSPNIDQHQFSPNNIHMLPIEMVMRVNKMITKVKMHWSANKLSQLTLEGNVWRSLWRIYMWILGLKGISPSSLNVSRLHPLVPRVRGGDSNHFGLQCSYLQTVSNNKYLRNKWTAQIHVLDFFRSDVLSLEKTKIESLEW